MYFQHSISAFLDNNLSKPLHFLLLSTFKSHSSSLSTYFPRKRNIITKISTDICHIRAVIYRAAIVGHAINLAAYKLCPRWFSNKRHSRTAPHGLMTIKRNVSPHSRGQCTLSSSTSYGWFCLAIHLGVHTRRTRFDL